MELGGKSPEGGNEGRQFNMTPRDYMDAHGGPTGSDYEQSEIFPGDTPEQGENSKGGRLSRALGALRDALSGGREPMGPGISNAKNVTIIRDNKTVITGAGANVSITINHTDGGWGRGSGRSSDVTYIRSEGGDQADDTGEPFAGESPTTPPYYPVAEITDGQAPVDLPPAQLPPEQ